MKTLNVRIIDSLVVCRLMRSKLDPLLIDGIVMLARHTLDAII